MAEQLESLLQKIQDEAVTKADAAAATRRAAAEEQASATIAAAELRAKQIVADAEKQAAQLVHTGKKALEQSARDLLLYVRKAVEQQFNALLKGALPELIPVTVIQEMLIRIAAEARERGRTGEGVRIFVPEKEYKGLVDFFMHRFRDAAAQGAEVHPLPGLKAGFKIVLREKDVQYDFSDDAIVEMLSQLINPALAEILQNAVKK
ncbi:hypothetical protein GX586_14020 [bacterium]|nr:hypothetical protein [bacterium]